MARGGQLWTEVGGSDRITDLFLPSPPASQLVTQHTPISPCGTLRCGSLVLGTLGPFLCSQPGLGSCLVPKFTQRARPSQLLVESLLLSAARFHRRPARSYCRCLRVPSVLVGGPPCAGASHWLCPDAQPRLLRPGSRSRKAGSAGLLPAGFLR